MKILRQERHTVCFIEFEVSDLFIDLFLTYYLVNTRAILLVNFPQFYNDLLQDVNSATNVHHNLQGAVIPSSGSIGMRIQYPFLYIINMINHPDVCFLIFPPHMFPFLN